MYPKHYIDAYQDHQLAEHNKRISKTADGTQRNNPRAMMKRQNMDGSKLTSGKLQNSKNNSLWRISQAEMKMNLVY